MQPTVEVPVQKWYQSKIAKLAIALFIGSISFFAVSLNIVDSADLESAQTVYPKVKDAISLIQAGQVFTGISSLVALLFGYFRIFSTVKIIKNSLPESLRNAA